MKTIWKFVLDFSGEIQMPAGAKIIHAGLDPLGTACVWAEVSSENPYETTRLEILGTGHPVREGIRHVGSVVQGDFVWHIYAGATA